MGSLGDDTNMASNNEENMALMPGFRAEQTATLQTMLTVSVVKACKEILGSASSLLETQSPKNESQSSDSKPINKASSAPSPRASARSEPIIIDLEEDDLKVEDAKDFKQIKEEKPSVQDASRVKKIDKGKRKAEPLDQLPALAAKKQRTDQIHSMDLSLDPNEVDE